MEFDSEERYASAALFTLALHLCQVESLVFREWKPFQILCQKDPRPASFTLVS